MSMYSGTLVVNPSHHHGSTTAPAGDSRVILSLPSGLNVNSDHDNTTYSVNLYYKSSPTGSVSTTSFSSMDDRSRNRYTTGHGSGLRMSGSYNSSSHYIVTNGNYYWSHRSAGPWYYISSGTIIGKIVRHGSTYPSYTWHLVNNITSAITTSGLSASSRNGYSLLVSLDNSQWFDFNKAKCYSFPSTIYCITFNGTLSTSALEKLSTLSTSVLEKLSTLSTSALEKLSTLSTSVLEKLSTLSTSVLTTIGQYDVKILEHFMTEVLSNPNANITDSNYKAYFNYSELKMWSKVTHKIKKFNKDKLVESLNAIPEVDPTFKSSEMSTIEALFSNRTATETYTEHYNTGRNIYTAIASSVANMRG